MRKHIYNLIYHTFESIFQFTYFQRSKRLTTFTQQQVANEQVIRSEEKEQRARSRECHETQTQ